MSRPSLRELIEDIMNHGLSLEEAVKVAIEFDERWRAEEENHASESQDWTKAEIHFDAKCDYCGKPALYDAGTRGGPWAYMCQAHFDSEATGELGLGKGQRLVRQAENRLDTTTNLK